MTWRKGGRVAAVSSVARAARTLSTSCAVSAATASGQNTDPTIDAAAITARSSSARVSSRDARSPWIDSGSGMLGPGAQPMLALLPNEQVAVPEEPDQLLGIERIAFAQPQDGGLELLGNDRPEQPDDQCRRVRLTERLQVQPDDAFDTGREAGRPLEDLRPRRRHHEHRGVGAGSRAAR